MKVEVGTIEAINTNETQNPLCKTPVLQIISYQKIGSTTGEKFRYRANISDGSYYMRAVFSSEITSLFDKDLISKYSIIKFDKYCLRSLKGNKYLYIQEISSYENCNIEIGKPVNYETGKASYNDGREMNVRNDVPKDTNIKNSNNIETMTIKSNLNNQNFQFKENNIGSKRQINNENNLKKMKTQESNEEITPINSINPFHNKWIIRGRVVIKNDIKKYSNKRGDGKLFSFELADETGQIKLVAFSEYVDVYYPIIEVGKVYTIKKGQVKMSNKQYSVNNNDYEIHLDQTSEINVVNDSETPKFFFNFVKIKDVTPSNSSIDIIGVVKEAFPISTFIVKSTQKENTRKDIVLVDETGIIRCTFWGSKAEEEIEVDSVLAIKNIKVSDYNGVSLSSINSSQIHINPDINEAHILLGWYNENGKNIKINIPERELKISYLSDIKNYEMPFSSCRATLIFFKEDNMMYESCKEEGCTKKVFKNEFGEYRCEKCDKNSYECTYRYMMQINISDCSETIWATLFNDQAVSLFGISCDEFRDIAENDPNQSQVFIKKFLFKDYIIKLRSRQETYNDEVRMRYNVSEIRPIKYDEECRKNINKLEKLFQ